jgi:electron transfer flavoprotein alpha subunit
VSVVLALVLPGADGPAHLDAGALSFARTLAEAAGDELHTAVVGPASDEVVSSAGAHGAAVVHALGGEDLDVYAPAAWAAAVLALHDETDVRAVVAAGDDRGAEVMAHLAARADLPLAASCTRAEPTDGGWALTRVRWGGVLLEDALLRAPTGLFTVAPHQVAGSPAAEARSPEVRTRTPTIDPDALVGRVVETATLADGISLATAPVVVSGGRGVGSAEGFAVLEELAGLLGGAVGCSRVATNNGWRSHNDQVGQTGTRVSPDLYIACGISGATQHWVGCMGAKRILAINTDAEAPMVTRADYAVLGDLHEILPAVVATLRARTGR